MYKTLRQISEYRALSAVLNYGLPYSPIFTSLDWIGLVSGEFIESGEVIRLLSRFHIVENRWRIGGPGTYFRIKGTYSKQKQPRNLFLFRASESTRYLN